MVQQATTIGMAVLRSLLISCWLLEGNRAIRLAMLSLSASRREKTRLFLEDLKDKVGAYTRGLVILCAIIGLLQTIAYLIIGLPNFLPLGILLGLGLWAMGMKYPTLLAIFGALAWLVPWLGGLLAVLPVALVGFSQSIGLGILGSVYAIGVLVFIEFFVQPRFIRKRKFSALLPILLMVALVEPFGLLGFIVAPPIAAAVELRFHYYLQNRQTSFSLESARRISALRARILEVRKIAEQNDRPLEPQTRSMLQRLENLIRKADDLIEEDQPQQGTPYP
jgi:putative permease